MSTQMARSVNLWQDNTAFQIDVLRMLHHFQPLVQRTVLSLCTLFEIVLKLGELSLTYKCVFLQDTVLVLEISPFSVSHCHKSLAFDKILTLDFT